MKSNNYTTMYITFSLEIRTLGRGLVEVPPDLPLLLALEETPKPRDRSGLIYFFIFFIFLFTWVLEEKFNFKAKKRDKILLRQDSPITYT